MHDDPAVVTEVAFTVQSRRREDGVEIADKTANAIFGYVGGEPWIMVDDDWQRVHPDNRITLVDDQGFMYIGKRRYMFTGPLVANEPFPQRDGWRIQGDRDA